MKLNLIVDNEKIIMPNFELYLDEKENYYIIAIKDLLEEEENKILDNINNNNYILEKNNNLILLNINNVKYCFDIAQYILLNQISIDFLDTNNIIKNKRKKIIVYEN